MKIDFAKMDGLIPAVIQDIKTNDVLMLGFMNKEAWEKTLKTGKVTFWSRTRNQFWTKGKTSGNFLIVKKIYLDCDQDSVLIKAKPKGPTCHTEEKVGLKMNVEKKNLQKLISILPTLKSPTITELADKNWIAVEIIINEEQVRKLIPQLKQFGARSIVEYSLNKIVE